VEERDGLCILVGTPDAMRRFDGYKQLADEVCASQKGLLSNPVYLVPSKKARSAPQDEVDRGGAGTGSSSSSVKRSEERPRELEKNTGVARSNKEGSSSSSSSSARNEERQRPEAKIANKPGSQSSEKAHQSNGKSRH
jgi:hypothetical protein